MQYVIPQEQYVVPQEQYVMAPPQYMMGGQPQYVMGGQPEIMAVPYGCGSCKGKFGAGKGVRRLSSDLAAGLTDPYNELADSFAKSRIVNPIIHGMKLKTAKRRKYGAGSKKGRKAKSPRATALARRRRAAAAATRARRSRSRSPSPRYY